MRPEDMAITIDGRVMAYLRFSVDFYVNGGIVTVLQQPSFLRLGRLNAAIFYVPNLQWGQCTPKNWRQSLPADWQPTRDVGQSPTPSKSEGKSDQWPGRISETG